MKNEILLNQLVANAFDFFNKSISELKKYPKYSVINFNSGVELILKTRLMMEHWSLIISQRQEPDWNRFIKGDFYSITLQESIERLEKVINSPISSEKIKAFKEIGKHRNKIVHFFHEAHSSAQNKIQIQTIAKEQLKAWYYLHQLLTEQWKDEFKMWNKPINEIHTKLKKTRQYLSIIFDQIKPKITEGKKLGYSYYKCPSCGFKSLKNEKLIKILYEASCLVCDLKEPRLRINCINCSNLVIFENEGFGKCLGCNKFYNPEDLAEIMIDQGEAHIAIKDGDDSYGYGNCSDCDGYLTIVKTEEQQIICTTCLTEFTSLQNCEWCNIPNSGDMKESYLTGCNHCAGHIDWSQDD